jgi:Flp pilus assembly pilin Flp
MLFSPRARGQGVLEYALILIVIMVVLCLAVSLIGTQITSIYSTVKSFIP